MNCPNCSKPMTPATDAGQTVTVTHSCACGHKHTVSFAKSATKPVSKVGHVLSTSFGATPVNYVIIGQYRNHLRRLVYVCSEWNSTSNRFLEISEDSYFLIAGKGKISATAYPMNEAHKAMSRAYRMMRLLKLVNRSLRRIGSGAPFRMQAVAQTNYRGRYEMDDKTVAWLMTDPEYLFGSPHVKAQRITLRNKLIGMIQAELSLAGITV